MSRFEKDRIPVKGGAITRVCVKCHQEFVPNQSISRGTDPTHRLCPECSPVESGTKDVTEELMTDPNEKLRDGFNMRGQR